MAAEDWHIALVGLPGAGKSTVARLVGERLERPVLDFDDEIERRAGMLIPEIFAMRGESEFRSMEEQLTRELMDAPPMVLSPGGGWVTRPEVVDLIRPRTILAWLMVSPSAATRRMGGGVARRPLLMKGDPRHVLEDILTERAPLYGASDTVIDTEVLTPLEVAQQIVRLASYWQGRVG